MRPSRRDCRREVEEQLYEFDDADLALLEHILGDDRPPQGLHQGGFQRSRTADLAVRDREEDDWVEAYLWPDGEW